MREILDIYIRSLAEREDADDAPEYRQDLGTFLDWLLEHSGYTILMHPYKHSGVKRKKSAGDKQWGVDLLASKPDPDGVDRLYRFVLKKGDIGSAEWGSGVPGKMQEDLWAAAERPDIIDTWSLPADSIPTRRTLVAVHNGDVGINIGPQISSNLQKIKERFSIDVKWWKADDLVDLTINKPGEPSGATLFPPALRPAIRMAIDSLQKSSFGSLFELDAIDRLLDQIQNQSLLPHGDKIEKQGNTTPLLRLGRHLSELALFSAMLEEYAQRDAKDSTLPILDSIERIACKSASWLQRLPADELRRVCDDGKGGPQIHALRIHRIFERLISQYVKCSKRLLSRLEQLHGIRYGLALAAPSDILDYPMRTLRLSGYLAIAGLAQLERGEHADAVLFANSLEDLWTQNPGGALQPVTDDQIIEFGLVYELWLRLGKRDVVQRFVRLVLERLAVRNACGLPMPAIWQRARIPMDPEELRILAETYFQERAEPPAAFQDNSSTIITLHIYLAQVLSGSIDFEVLSQFAPQIGENRKAKSARTIFLQSWRPPEDASAQWYDQDVSKIGTSKVYDLSQFGDMTSPLRGRKFTTSTERMVAEFEEFHKSPIQESIAARLKLTILDRIAWKRWRIPLVMSVFRDLAH